MEGMQPPRLLAAACAAVLAGGVTVAIVAGTDGSAPTPVARAALTPAPRPGTAASGPVPAGIDSPKARHRHTPPTPRPAPQRDTVAAKPLYPLPAPPAYPHPCPPPPIKPGPPVKPPKPAVKTARLPAVLPIAPHRRVDLAPIRGKGMWLTTWPDSRLDVATVVARARAAGLTQLWIRTGGTYQGWYGGRFLTTLLPAAHAAGIDVVAWDYPTLSDPAADARRAARAITGTFGGQRIDAFSPDIEEIAEGTFDSPRRVRVYLSRVRRAAGSMPVVATVLRPLDGHLSDRPYRAMAPYVDAFAPMIYWSCNEPGATALSALRPLAKLRPVHLIGQSYNMGPEGGRHGLPTGREIWRFLDVAKRGGAVGASLYLYEQTRRSQWRALTRYPWPAAAAH